MIKKILFMGIIITLTGCSGVRTTNSMYSTHAENFNILFLKIPGGDTQERAMELIPEGADITSIDSSPDDLSSFVGFINRIFGVDITVISGTMSSNQ